MASRFNDYRCNSYSLLGGKKKIQVKEKRHTLILCLNITTGEIN